MHNRFLALMLTAWAGAHGVSASQPAAGSAALVVDGDVTKPLSLTAADLKALPRTKVEVKAENGTINVYEGVLAGELLKMAGLPLGQMRGGVVASYAIASAADGYQAVFAVAELDPGFTSSNVIVPTSWTASRCRSARGRSAWWRLKILWLRARSAGCVVSRSCVCRNS